jgi:hypothetical protein
VTDNTALVTRRLLIIAFEGWNDAGEAASGAVRTLHQQLTVHPLAQIDPEPYYDYQFNRPTITASEDGQRSIKWPGTTFFGPTEPVINGTNVIAPPEPEENNSRNIFLLLGSEPSRGWKSFTAEIIDRALAADIGGIVILGSMLADVPHTRAIPTFVSSENAELRAQLDVDRSTYEWPIGILTVIAQAAETAGIPALTIWASVPHYVHNAPSPKAMLALIEKLEEYIDVTIPRGNLIDDATAWENGINELARDDDDMAAYIKQLEQARDTVDSPEASGEAIAQEFERYLRGGDGGREGKNSEGPPGAI